MKLSNKVEAGEMVCMRYVNGRENATILSMTVNATIKSVITIQVCILSAYDNSVQQDFFTQSEYSIIYSISCSQQLGAGPSDSPFTSITSL